MFSLGNYLILQNITPKKLFMSSWGKYARNITTNVWWISAVCGTVLGIWNTVLRNPENVPPISYYSWGCQGTNIFLLVMRTIQANYRKMKKRILGEQNKKDNESILWRSRMAVSDIFHVWGKGEKKVKEDPGW